MNLMRLISILFMVFILAAGITLVGCASGSKTAYQSSADREGIRQVVRQRISELEPCYLEAIEKRPGAEGKIVLEWTLNFDGLVESIKVKEAGPKIEMASDCVMSVVKTWKFPPPESNEFVTVQYPFIFSENGRVPNK